MPKAIRFNLNIRYIYTIDKYVVNWEIILHDKLSASSSISAVGGLWSFLLNTTFPYFLNNLSNISSVSSFTFCNIYITQIIKPIKAQNYINELQVCKTDNFITCNMRKEKTQYWDKN